MKENLTKEKLFYTLERIQSNVFFIKSTNQLSDSILNYFTMAIGLFMFGCIQADIIFTETAKKIFYGFLIVAGIAQIGLGIYDWYKGKSLSLLVNVLFGFLFISWYFKNIYKELDDSDIKKIKSQDQKYEGAYYIFWFVLTIIIIIGVKNKGIIYSLDYLIIAVGFLFIFIHKYVDQDWSKKVYGYVFFVSGCFFWITGLLRFMNSTLLNKKFIIVKE